MFPTDEAMAPGDLARAAEERGFDSLWFPEHTHIPASRRSPWPGGSELPREYSRTYDPFVALSMAAAVTTTIKLGTGVCLMVERDPIVTAKAVASLDHLSGGRVQFGVGGGWNLEEMENHGTDPARRWRVLRERVEAMKEIWMHDEASYDGEFVKFDRIWSWPKPMQKPHPPIVMGGDSPKTLERIVKYADQWMPILGRNPEPIGERIKRLQDLAAAAGRGPIPVGIFAAPANPKVIADLASQGVTTCLLALPPAPAETVLKVLDSHAALVATL